MDILTIDVLDAILQMDRHVDWRYFLFVPMAAEGKILE